MAYTAYEGLTGPDAILEKISAFALASRLVDRKSVV